MMMIIVTDSERIVPFISLSLSSEQNWRWSGGARLRERVRCITEGGTQNSAGAPPLDRRVSIDRAEPRREPAYTVVSDDVVLSRLSSFTGENTSGDATSCDVTDDDVTSSTTMRHVSASAAQALLVLSPITDDLP